MDLQEIVRRLRMNQSIKAIKRETGKHRSVIRRVRELAEQEGWLVAADLPGDGSSESGTTNSRRPSAAPYTRWIPTARRSPDGSKSLQLPGDPQTVDGAGGGVLGDHRAPLHPPALP